MVPVGGFSLVPLRASIVIPTYNRRQRLARVLDALDAQTTSPDAFEVVVIDDGSSDDTGSWLEKQQRRYGLRVIRQANAGPARARNAGVKAATGELLLFLDDDVEPLPALVAEHLLSHEREADVVVMGPLGSLPHYAQPWVAWEQAKLEEQYAAMKRGDWEPTFRQFWTGNASVERKYVVEAGGFNTEFLRAEDVELAYRLHGRGLKFRFNAEARGLHHAERSLASWEHAQRSYGELEVQIFSMWEKGALIGILAANWARLHPATKLLVGGCLKSRLAYEKTAAGFRTWLETAKKLERGLLSDKVCSAFANLLYWRASVDALGPTRSAEVFERASRLTRDAR